MPWERSSRIGRLFSRSLFHMVLVFRYDEVRALILTAGMDVRWLRVLPLAMLCRLQHDQPPSVGAGGACSKGFIFGVSVLAFVPGRISKPMSNWTRLPLSRS
jgi:hypothetical protein